MKSRNPIGITAVFLVFPLIAVTAESFVLPTFTLSAEISETTLLPGAPLYVYLTVTREKDTNPQPATVSITSIKDRVSVHINGPDSKETEKHLEKPWYFANGVEFSLYVPLASGESYTKTLIVHRWNTTVLPPGDYSVVVEASQLNFHMETNRQRWYPLTETPFKMAFPLQILSPDKEKVARSFEGMLATTITEGASWSDRYRAFDTIIFAQGNAALRSQLDLLAAMQKNVVRVGYGQKDIVTMLWYIVQRADVNTARALVALAKGPVFGEILKVGDHSGRGIWPMLGWAIHELHRAGSPEVQAVTSELLDLVPDKPGLVERTFQYGGIKIPRDY